MDDKNMPEETSQSVSRRGFIKGVIAAGAVDLVFLDHDTAPNANDVLTATDGRVPAVVRRGPTDRRACRSRGGTSRR
mgnify:CR=1 FL=1